MKRLFVALALLFSISLPVAVAQEKPVQDKDPKLKRLVEIHQRLMELDKKAQELSAEKEKLNAERKQLLAQAEKEAADESFKNSPPTVVLQIPGNEVLTLFINGREQQVRLSGVLIFLAKSSEAAAFLKEQLKDGLVYVRCVNPACFDAYLYVQKDGPSLNAEILRRDLGYRSGPGQFDVADFDAKSSQSAKEMYPSTGLTGTSSSTGGSRSTPGTEVNVKGYYRKDGTYVRPHTRSKPTRKN